MDTDTSQMMSNEDNLQESSNQPKIFDYYEDFEDTIMDIVEEILQKREAERKAKLSSNSETPQSPPSSGNKTSG